MANNNSRNAEKPNNTLLNIIVVAIIAVFLAAGVYATYGKIASSIEDKAISSGEKEPTVAYLAKTAGMSVEDYLAQYGLELNDTITKDTTEADLLDNMTIENYLKYDGNTQTAEEVIEGTGLTDKVTKDTLWKDFLPQVPAVSVMGEEYFNSIKEQLGLGDEVNYDTTYGEMEELINQKMQEQTDAASADSTEAESADNTEAEGSETEAAPAE